MSEVIPDGWRLTTIDEIAETYAGGTPNTQILEYWENGDIPWMSSGEVHNKRITHTHQRITTLGYKNSSAKFFPEKTVLIALAGQGKTRGTVAISEITLTTNQSIAGIVISDRKTIPDYVFHNLDSRYEELRAASGGSGRAGLNLSIIGEQSILLPPLPEQQKIAIILSSVDDVIEKTRAQIEKLKDLKTGMMQELLTQGIGHTEFKDSPVGKIPTSWSTSTIGETFLLASGGTPSRDNACYFSSGRDAHPWVKTMDLNDDILTATDESITDDAIAYSACKIFPAETVLIAMYGGWNQIGRTAILGISAATNQAICALLPSQKVSDFFTNYWLIGMRHKWKSIAASSRKDPNITKQDVSDFLIAIPPKTEQQLIVEKLHHITTMINSVVFRLFYYESLKKALMQDLLTGKVRVNVAPTETAAA